MFFPGLAVPNDTIGEERLISPGTVPAGTCRTPWLKDDSLRDDAAESLRSSLNDVPVQALPEVDIPNDDLSEPNWRA